MDLKFNREEKLRDNREGVLEERVLILGFGALHLCGEQRQDLQVKELYRMIHTL